MFLLRNLSKYFIAFGILFLLLSLVLFGLFAPVRTIIFGYALSFASLDNPLKISLSFVLIGIFFHWVGDKKAGLPEYSLLVVIFSLVFLVHLSSSIITSIDSRYSLFTAKSILKEGNINLDEYKQMVDFDKDNRIVTIAGHSYNFFPMGPSILSLPIVFLTSDELIKTSFGEIERLNASLIIALTSIFIYLIAISFIQNRTFSLLLVFIFAFCTSSWSTASRGLWQHGPSMLVLTLTLYLLILAKSNPGLIQYASLPLAFSYVIRPTNIISVLGLTLFVFIQYRRYFIRYLLWALVIVIPFLIVNVSVSNSLLSPYYFPNRIGANNDFLLALFGNLISPSRGLFIFSPILLFSLIGIYLKFKTDELATLDHFLIGIMFLHWIAISTFPHWWAGHSFGPRFLSDLIPFFIYFLIPVLNYIPRLMGIKKAAFISVFCCLIVFSFLVHYRGANSPEVYVWNSQPANVDNNPERIWNWHDPQFLRGLK